MIDALHPFVEVLGQTRDVGKAVEAAKLGAEGTKGMRARLGRGVYVGGDGWKIVPDAGAWGVAMFLGGLVGGGSAGPSKGRVEVSKAGSEEGKGGKDLEGEGDGGFELV